MKISLILVITSILLSEAWCKDGLFDVNLPWHAEASVEDGSVLVKLPMEARPDLKGTTLILDRYGDEKQPYTLSMHLAEIPEDNPKPVLVNGKKALVGKLNLGAPGASISFEVRDLREAKAWLKFLKNHFKIDDSKVNDKTAQ